MSDYISREEAIRAVYGMVRPTGIDEMPYEYAEHVIADLPSVDVRPNIHAYWEDLEPDKDILFKSNMPYRCTACGQRAGKHKVITYKYCPSCGAIMDGEPKGEKGTE